MSNQYFSTPSEALAHFGAKGMKWGVRKNREPKPKLTGLGLKPTTRKMPNGDKLTLTPMPPTVLNKALARISPNKYVKSYNNGQRLTVTDSSGKKVGDAQFGHFGKDEIYLGWIGIDESARGKGYATEILKASAEYGKANGKKRMVLDVPDTSPDARHIYEKLGFKSIRGERGDDSVAMEYRFD